VELVVDANVWLSACGSQEPCHAEAVAFLKRCLELNALFLLPALILPEVSGTASRRTRDEQDGRALVEQLQRLPKVLFFDLDMRRAREAARLAGQLFLRGADAQYAALALERHAPLITLDREMLQRAKGTVDCVTPSEWLAR